MHFLKKKKKSKLHSTKLAGYFSDTLGAKFFARSIASVWGKTTLNTGGVEGAGGGIIFVHRSHFYYFLDYF